MDKRGIGNKGQIQLSFGMIFSIIIIIVTVAVGFYVIKYFVELSNCTDTSLFYNDLKEKINRAWSSPITREVWTGNLPGKVESVCFGNLSLPGDSMYQEEYNALRIFRTENAGLYIYPLTNQCGKSVPFYKLEHVKDSRFFCIPAEDGKIRIMISKNSTDALVTLTEG